MISSILPVSKYLKSDDYSQSWMQHYQYINGSVQDYSNSSVLAMELLQ